MAKAERFLGLVLLFCWLVLARGAFASGPPALKSQVKVLVLSRYPTDQLEISGLSIRVQTEGGVTSNLARIHLRAEGGLVHVTDPPLRAFSRLWIDGMGNAFQVQVSKDLIRRFNGRLAVEAHDGILRSVLELPRESYVRGVLSAEMPGDFPIEAQKAQAVLIRSYARAQAGRHAREGFDFCDLTHCQVYGGLDVGSGLRDEAIRATRSLILTDGRKAVEGLFHSTCGGHTSPNQRVFGGQPLPYLQGVDDGSYCKASPHSEWSARLPLAKISAAVAGDERYAGVAPLSGLSLAEHEPGGRVFSLRLEGPRRETIPAMDFLSLVGKAFGWNQLKSNWFEVEVKDGIAEFHGRGSGHGVGLCQWGARGMAEDGKRFDEILRHYFPGTKLQLRP